MMFLPINIDKAIQYIKNIVDEIKCSICDSDTGSRVRYWCGHTACSECAVTLKSCLLCLTPPDAEGTLEPVLDKVLTKRVKNARALLDAFQNTFYIDVFKRQRLSEQLKVERELFPRCIQASQTYHNKNRSFNASLKENIKRSNIIFPGETINSPFAKKMNDSKTFVTNWLEQHENELLRYQLRSPFSDLNVNSPVSPQIKKGHKGLHKSYKAKHEKEINKSIKGSRKLLLTDTKLKRPGEILQQRGIKRSCKGSDKTSLKENLSITKNNESGIVIDDDTIIIEDSQTETIDKDRLAWLAVLKADENSTSAKESKNSVSVLHYDNIVREKEDISLNKEVQKDDLNPFNWLNSETCTEFKKTFNQRKANIPFYKRSHLKECCYKCSKSINSRQSIKTSCKDVSIAVETTKFKTVIEIKQSTPQYTNFSSRSKLIQTDICQSYPNNKRRDDNSASLNTHLNKYDLIKNSSNLEYCDGGQSQDLFVSVSKRKDVMENKKTIILSECGSDSDNDQHNISLTVKADVHRSFNDEERKILRELPEARLQKCKKRSYTPDSNNSSDKENIDPNAKKNRRSNKKEQKKK